jgi:5'-3' exonuclease
LQSFILPYDHLASYSCAERLVEQSLELHGQPVDTVCEQIICRYFVTRCEELLRYATIRSVYIVFDGTRCPLKEATNKDREERRRKNLEEARHFKALGRNNEASEKYKACIKIAPWMATSVARALEMKFTGSRESHPLVHVVFSPYEADAQLAKLCLDGICDAVVTEDSDILVYSALTQIPFPIIYKLDRDNGNCDVITMDWLLTHHTSRSQPNNNEFSNYRRYIDIHSTNQKKASDKEKRPKNSFQSTLVDMALREAKHPGYGVRMFVQACILTGCDYAPSRLNGVGVVNAFRLVKDFANRNANDRFSIILKSLPSSTVFSVGNVETDPVVVYEDLLARSEAAFFFHKVLDIRSHKIVHLSHLNVTDGKIDDYHDTSVVPCLKRFRHDLSFLGCDIEMQRDDTIGSLLPLMISTHGSDNGMKNRRVSHSPLDLKENDGRSRKQSKCKNMQASNPFSQFASAMGGGRFSLVVEENRVRHNTNRDDIKKTLTNFNSDDDENFIIERSKNIHHNTPNVVTIFEEEEDVIIHKSSMPIIKPSPTISSSDSVAESVDCVIIEDSVRNRLSSKLQNMQSANKSAARPKDGNKRVLSRVSQTIDLIERSVASQAKRYKPLAESTNTKTPTASGRKIVKKTTVINSRKTNSITSFFKPLSTSES